MSTLTQYTKERDRATTEWDDIQRRIGNLPALEAPPAEDSPFPELEQPVAAAAAHDDDDELARLRAMRLDELKQRSVTPRFGSVAPLAHADYVAEVCRAGKGVGVVVFLHKEGHYQSAYMLVLLEKLARKFGDLKFLRIASAECIPGYPDRNLPTLFLYRDDDLLRRGRPRRCAIASRMPTARVPEPVCLYPAQAMHRRRRVRR